MSEPMLPSEVFIEATQDLFEVMRAEGFTDWSDVEARLRKWEGGGMTEQMLVSLETAWNMGL